MNSGHVYLIGMMGSGKSVTAEVLARRLGRIFIDLDAEIEKREGKAVSEIFAKKGEDYFRKIETGALEETLKRGAAVIATGGGIILREQNRRLLRESGKTVYLKTSEGVLWDRVKNSGARPLLKSENPREKLVQILAERESLYQSMADYTVNTDDRTADDVARQIGEWVLEQNQG